MVPTNPSVHHAYVPVAVMLALLPPLPPLLLLPLPPLCEHGGAVLGVAAEGPVQLGDLLRGVHVPQLLVADRVEQKLRAK